MRSLNSNELVYVGQLTVTAAEGTGTVWSRETGHVTPHSVVPYMYDIEDAELEAACEVPGLMTTEELKTCTDSFHSTEVILNDLDTAHAQCFINNEPAKLQHLNSIVIKTALFSFIARFMDELAEETRKAA